MTSCTIYPSSPDVRDICKGERIYSLIGEFLLYPGSLIHCSVRTGCHQFLYIRVRLYPGVTVIKPNHRIVTLRKYSGRIRVTDYLLSAPLGRNVRQLRTLAQLQQFRRNSNSAVSCVAEFGIASAAHVHSPYNPAIACRDVQLLFSSPNHIWQLKQKDDILIDF